MSSKIITEIRDLAKKKQVLILAHFYQNSAIYEIADYIGDSLELAQKGAQTKAKIILFCGVKFMAETAKILNPTKKVLLPVLDAGCPLAETLSIAQLKNLKKQHPQAAVVCYINSSTAIKAAANVVCTSANAVQIVKNLRQKEVIFVPDYNLGSLVAQKIPNKKIILFKPGKCLAHTKITAAKIQKLQQQFPAAKVLAHGECNLEVQALAHKICGTAGMVKFAQRSKAQEFIVATEANMANYLKQKIPNKKFYTLQNQCRDMRKTTLEKVLLALKTEKPEIKISPMLAQAARRSTNLMLQTKS